MRVSTDGGSSYETTGYSFKIEDGGNESQRSEFSLYPISTTTAGTNTSMSVLMFAESVNVAAPMFGWGAHFGVSGKTSSMHKASTAVTDLGLIWLDAAFTDHVAGSTGTVYLTGRA